MQIIKKTTLALATVSALAFSGCATWSTSTVDKAGANTQTATATTATSTRPTPVSHVMITGNDIVDRQYAFLGDVTVTVNKTTIFHPEPTRDMVNEKLREKGAELGADAVILVRYGSGGVSLWSWGSLEGKGRAIKFAQ